MLLSLGCYWFQTCFIYERLLRSLAAFSHVTTQLSHMPVNRILGSLLLLVELVEIASLNNKHQLTKRSTDG
jgi:hypothetical protein